VQLLQFTSRVSALLLCFIVFGVWNVQAAERPWLSENLSAADARHLLSRTGFDASPEAQLAFSGVTRSEAIDTLMQGFRTEPHLAMPRWTQAPAPQFWAKRDLTVEARRRFDRTRDAELAELRQWWVDEMLTTPSPQTERMVLFWHDHFATAYQGVNRQSISMARQNQTFRELGMGDFRTLLQAMIRDPALLNYLDNNSNQRAKPNENFARELLELFTLGEGAYDEFTVREAARALTGYSFSQVQNLSFQFQQANHDSNEKNLFGTTGQLNGDDLINLLLQQPALDKHIATRFWHWLVSDQKPTSVELSFLAQSFRQSGHRLEY